MSRNTFVSTCSHPTFPPGQTAELVPISLACHYGPGLIFYPVPIPLGKPAQLLSFTPPRKQRFFDCPHKVLQTSDNRRTAWGGG